MRSGNSQSLLKSFSSFLTISLPSFGLDGLPDKPRPAVPQGAITWNSTPSAPNSIEKQACPSKMTLTAITNGQQVEDRQEEQPESTRDASSERPAGRVQAERPRGFCPLSVLPIQKTDIAQLLSVASHFQVLVHLHMKRAPAWWNLSVKYKS